MKSLKQQLAERSDVREKEIELTSLGGEPMHVTIRRVTVGERDRVMHEYKLGTEEGKGMQADASVAIVCLALVSPEGETITREDVHAMPATVVDEIAKHVMEFNGWTKGGKAVLDDQFRSPA